MGVADLRADPWRRRRRGGTTSAARASGRRCRPCSPKMQLRGVRASRGHPVYWAGPQENRRYGADADGEGRIYIRYLTPQGADRQPGKPLPHRRDLPGLEHLRRAADGRTALRLVPRCARNPGRSWSGRPRTRAASTSRSRPANFQVEVYDPQKGPRPRSRAPTGRVKPHQLSREPRRRVGLLPAPAGGDRGRLGADRRVGGRLPAATAAAARASACACWPVHSRSPARRSPTSR